jgi:hypothetical protein
MRPRTRRLINDQKRCYFKKKMTNQQAVYHMQQKSLSNAKCLNTFCWVSDEGGGLHPGQCPFVGLSLAYTGVVSEYGFDRTTALLVNDVKSVPLVRLPLTVSLVAALSKGIRQAKGNASLAVQITYV